MRKVIGIGETILDIIFKEEIPTAAVPGGSSFNGIVSLARAGIETCFISETGNDKVGDMIVQFMKENQISTEYVRRFPDGKSPVSLAFLDRENEASYLFYKEYPKQRLEIGFPTINPDDIILFGAYYSLNPATRHKIVEFLKYARAQKAIIYYDPNFRAAHSSEAAELTPCILENMEYADLIRGAIHDFSYMFGIDDAELLYQQKIQLHCPNFICTQSQAPALLRTQSIHKKYPVPKVPVTSTIGAGDNFNAGIIYGLLKYQVTREQLYTLHEELWDKIMCAGIAFSQDVCQSYSNSISSSFAENLRHQ